MVRLSLGEIVIILVVLVVAFGGRVQAARTEAKRSPQPGRKWSPAVVTFVFVMLLGGGFFFFRAVGTLLRMMKR